MLAEEFGIDIAPDYGSRIVSGNQTPRINTRIFTRRGCTGTSRRSNGDRSHDIYLWSYDADEQCDRTQRKQRIGQFHSKRAKASLRLVSSGAV
jgi:hypothetical protein